MIHPLADVQSSKIGKQTRIWQFCVVLPEAQIGGECNICSHCFVENDVVIGDRVTVKCGVQLWDGIELEDDVFVGPNVTFTNDSNPRSQQYPEKFLRTIVKKGASIGANATILPGITIGKDAMVGAGSVVTSNVPPGAVVIGNPARVVRCSTEGVGSHSSVSAKLPKTDTDCYRWLDLTSIQDSRGKLCVVEWSKHLPFSPKRVFFVHQVPSKKVRGAHAHKECIQILLCLNGSVNVALDCGSQRQELVLDTADQALLIPAGIWATQYFYSADAVLAVFASHEYDEADYIRDYDEYLEYRNL